MAIKPFLDNDFLLHNEVSQALYHDHAKAMPIFDYHCHLPPQEIAEDKNFANLTQIWLYGDHYKWRAMRTNGVDERFVTGEASDEEKFNAWAETVPATLRNPLYHWTHMELKNPFGIERLLDPQSADEIYQQANEKLQTSAFSTQGLLKHFDVRCVCTTDDPTDSLEHHQKIQGDTFSCKVLPTFRPDKGMAVEDTSSFLAWLDLLQQSSGLSIQDFDAYLNAIKSRHDFFHEMGCRLSDHGIEEPYAEDYSSSQIDSIFAKLLDKQDLNPDEILVFKSAMLFEFALMDAEKGWTQQFHFGALRNNNTRLLQKLGPDTGFDSIGDFSIARNLSKFLNRLDSEDHLARTILYNLNPRDNDLIATMIGNFQDGSIPGKLQFGSGWWFLDQKEGMTRQINSLSNMGLLSRFVGMLTDSRSFLSYPRHDYFRRILCQILGEDVANGELPNDIDLLGKMVKDICFNNASNYFGIEL